MRTIPIETFLVLACLVWVTGARPAGASETARTKSPAIAGLKLDERGQPAYLARFQDGPRRVPIADGIPKIRAQRLGIGTAQVARKLLRQRPSRALMLEVQGERPKQLLWPVERGRFGRGFGLTRRMRRDLPHNGIDIGAAEGDVVRAAADGLVVYSDNGLRGYGNCVLILHAGGLLTLYAHNERTTVQAGALVERGERIALVGKTGYAWGPHLHFEVRINGRLIDPMRFLEARRQRDRSALLLETSRR